MNKVHRCLLAILIIIIGLNCNAQFHISGVISDRQTSEHLIGANIIESGNTNGTASDNAGYFSLIIKNATVKVSFIGYNEELITVYSDTLLQITLSPGAELNEVLVKGRQTHLFNVASISLSELKKLPSLGGQPDVLKALQTLPGVETGQEGSSRLNVRGGSPGENLYLIDKVPLIYVNHLGGFLSVFNPEMINNIELYKGGFPAQYGGKLSSVVNITQREGNRSKMKGSFGIGVTDASFSIEGPLLNKKASFIFTGRKTLTEPLFLAIAEFADDDNAIYYGFHDFNGKFSFHPNAKNNFYLNFYQGDDYIHTWNRNYKRTKERFNTKYRWGNWMVSGRWNSLLSPRIMVENTVSYTRYRLLNSSKYTATDDSITTNFKSANYSTVADLSFQSDWKYKLLSNWSLDVGLKATSNQFVPTRTVISTKEAQDDYEIMRPYQMAIYCSNRISILNRFNSDIGLRLVNYHLGDYSHWALEPRVDLNYSINVHHTLNLSLQRVNQYSHLLFTAGNIFNNEVWIPAGKKIPPSGSNQISFGWKADFFDGMLNTEANVFYKELSQLATYKEGYSGLLGDKHWQNKIEIGGQGYSQGIELSIQKVKGKWTGFSGYTYSHTTRQFETIYGGKEYVYEYDRPHSFTFNLNRKLNEKWDLALTWVYQTGLPYTPVVGRQIASVIATGVGYTEEFIYGERNSSRMKNYHRLDIGFTYTTQTHWGNKAVWTFSVYNAYSRHNSGSNYYGYNENGFVRYNSADYTPLKQYQTSYFPIVPSVSYKVYFGERKRAESQTKRKFGAKLKNLLFYEYN